jgi:hypothetical protein
MRLARLWGFSNVDTALDGLSPAQFDEWAAFERLEPSTPERLHAQLTAIGGALLYELQVISYYLAPFVLSREDAEKLSPPKVPDMELLDPGRPVDSVASKKKPAKASRADREEFVSPAIAMAMMRSQVRSS